MNETIRGIRSDVKRWVEQERVWDDALYCSPDVRQAHSENPVSSSEKGKLSSQDSKDQSQKEAPPNDVSTAENRAASLAALYERYKDCTRCSLGSTRIKIVFGVGNPNSKVLFIGEGPGYEEDRRGEPFVGKAGQLLDKMMAAIGLSRQTNAYIANIVKCHPMANPATPDARNNDRPPSPDEVASCAPILLQQIAILQPRVIMTLGSPSSKMILRTKDGITGLRGKLFPFQVDSFYPEPAGQATDLFGSGSHQSTKEYVRLDAPTREVLKRTQVLPTYHPAALLRNPNLKPESWADLKLLREILAKP